MGSLTVEEIIQRNVKGQSLTSINGEAEVVEVERLSGDASTRTYYRVRTSGGQIIACLDPKFNLSLDEYPFGQIQKLLKERNIRVPEIILANDKDRLILQEDLGDLTLLSHLSSLSNLEEEFITYKGCLDVLISMQRITSPADRPHPFSGQRFDREKLMWEISFTQEHFMKNLLGVLPRHLGDLLKLEKHFLKIAEELDRQQMVFTHRDFHSRNIMMKDGQLVLIDFQDARMGQLTYDLVSLLEDCYYEIGDRNKSRLVDYYWNEFGKGMYAGSKDEFLRLYKLSAIQRIYKAIGSFSYLDFFKKDKKYLKYIGFAMERLKAILYSLPEQEQMRKLLMGIYYGL